MIALTRKKLLIGVLALGVLSALVFGYLQLRDSSHAVTSDGESVNLKPATKTEKQEAENKKKEIVQEQQEAAAKTSGSGNSTTDSQVTITAADEREVRAFVSGIFEEGGTCTAKATQGTKSITAQSEGFGNVSYTQCAPITWPTLLSSGFWNIAFTYQSAKTTASTTKTIEVK
jgi:hypothetical protein